MNELAHVQLSLSNLQTALAHYRKNLVGHDAEIAKIKGYIQAQGPTIASLKTLQYEESLKAFYVENIKIMEVDQRTHRREIKRLEYEAAVEAGPWC